MSLPGNLGPCRIGAGSIACTLLRPAWSDEVAWRRVTDAIGTIPEVIRNLAFGSIETPIGRHWVGCSELGVVAITRGDGPMELLDEIAHLAPDAGAIERESSAAYLPALDDALRQLSAYFAAERRVLDVPLDTRWAVPFDAAVWSAVRAIPYGTTASYGDVALAMGRPRAARAVGGALARCPVAPVVPCHRVIHADGSIGGWGGDLNSKRWLLDLEQRATSG
jgi:methylated-DNA-[protein]-cysteine S-methyltransferase